MLRSKRGERYGSRPGGDPNSPEVAEKIRKTAEALKPDAVPAATTRGHADFVNKVPRDENPYSSEQHLDRQRWFDAWDAGKRWVDAWDAGNKKSKPPTYTQAELDAAVERGGAADREIFGERLKDFAAELTSVQQQLSAMPVERDDARATADRQLEDVQRLQVDLAAAQERLTQANIRMELALGEIVWIARLGLQRHFAKL